jgi:hypothetical protein
MRPTTARTLTNVLFVSAGLAAAYVVVTTPRLRRLAGLGIRLWLGASVPGYLVQQVGRAWVESGRPA